MGTPHKYADVIKAWADGAAIQYRYTSRDDWVDIRLAADEFSGPGFMHNYEYRIKPDPYQHLKDAQAAGKRVQFFNKVLQTWEDNGGAPNFWLFSEEVERYRIVETELIEFKLSGPMGLVDVRVDVEFAGNDVLDVKVAGFHQ